MKLRQVLTSRGYRFNKCDYDIVHEWEDIFASSLNLPLVQDNKNIRSKYLCLKFPFIAGLLQTCKPSFLYTMLPLGNPPGNNKKNIVTCIIDFFLKEEKELQRFYNTYCNNPVVLISSKEAYEFLKSVNCPLKIEHLALSISDEYKINESTKFDKVYDVVMVGRQNKVLMQFLEQYKNDHPDLTYVYRKQNGKNWEYFDSSGLSLGNLPSRSDYISLLRKAKIGLYATPGMDGERPNTNGFNQVTPRFLEYLACGCHVIARYPKNADTNYYELEKFTSNIDNYDAFAKAMDFARSHNVNMAMYASYLQNHYTSVRAEQLKKILADL